MRIIAGAARGRRLKTPSGEATRPTSDRVKEALFSSLQPVLAGASVLDLYAGSGALGLEALSRGATSATFVESDGRALRALHDNVAVVGLSGAYVVADDVGRALGRELVGAPFDLVLIDAPYHTSAASLGRVLAAVSRVAADGARVVVERATRDGPPAWPAGLLADEPRRYGDTTLHRARVGERDQSEHIEQEGT